jgi:predicted 3-demethylubiquinone-9 3-methyltransferase (glyoxalase superfamily)
MQQTITPCLWFDDQAEEAATFYTSVFEDSEILDVSHYGEDSPRPAGTVLTVRFRIRGQEFTALNGGPEFTFSEAISFEIDCADQAEVDRYWEALAKSGEEGPCGWLKDRYGVSWQVVPRRLPELLNAPDRAGAQRVMQAMLATHGKLDVDTLEKAYAGS